MELNSVLGCVDHRYIWIEEFHTSLWPLSFSGIASSTVTSERSWFYSRVSLLEANTSVHRSYIHFSKVLWPSIEILCSNLRGSQKMLAICKNQGQQPRFKPCSAIFPKVLWHTSRATSKRGLYERQCILDKLANISWLLVGSTVGRHFFF